ncbi:Ubiquitin carboxyl-terminal hydrolase 7, variant 2 [Puccinia graminis f. sp. tritici]|uniref:Ubiquitin carboxyl-terminal hydrolase 7, variant 2 n=1 Tax=Puccinia graminis f. sp. tritici TaxID=56615 RepID=A0A5B0M6Q5_PUCGR|nr:Ubiquitin carboxyl-terminal hydrolase 7, variant 2 [Puccinia graminis f. sp. tritici]
MDPEKNVTGNHSSNNQVGTKSDLSQTHNKHGSRLGKGQLTPSHANLAWRMSHSSLRYRSPPIKQHHVYRLPERKNQAHSSSPDRYIPNPPYIAANKSYHRSVSQAQISYQRDSLNQSVSRPITYFHQDQMSIPAPSDQSSSTAVERYHMDQSATTLNLHRLDSHAPHCYHPYASHQHHHIKIRKPLDQQRSPCLPASKLTPRGQWGPLDITSNQIPRGQWGPLESVARRSTKQDNLLSERQKRNLKIFPRIYNPYFTEETNPHVKPFILQLNLNAEKPFIIQPANFSSHRVVATNNTGSQTLFFLEFHPLNPTDPSKEAVVKKLGKIISNLYFMGNNRQDIHPRTMETGIMKGVGFRPGSDRGSTAGTYARQKNLSQKILELDNYCWDQLGDHNQFLCNRVRHFSKQSFKDNAEIIESFGIPSWSNSKWNDFEQETNGIFSTTSTDQPENLSCLHLLSPVMPSDFQTSTVKLTLGCPLV